MTGDRLPVFFLKGVGQGLATAPFRKETLTDPLEPMPTVPEWLASYGVTPGGHVRVRPVRGRLVRPAGPAETPDGRVPGGRVRGHLRVRGPVSGIACVRRLAGLAPHSVRAGTHGPVGRRRGRRGKEPIMAMDIQDDQKVVVYKDGVDRYEGLWGNRDEDYDGDFYLLADVEEADIIVVC